MRKLSEILADIAQARATMKLDVADVRPAVRAGVEGMVRRAQRDIVEFEKEYRDTVSAGLVLVTVSGPKSREFGKIAAEKVLTLDNMLVVDEIAAEIERRTGRPRLGDQEYLVLMSALNDIKHRYEIKSLPEIREAGLARVVANIPVRDAVNKILVHNYGYQLHSIALQKVAAQKALDAKFDGAKLVLLVCGYEGLDNVILPTPLAEIRADGEPTEDSVTSELAKLTTKSPKPKGNRKGGKAAKETA